MSFLLLPMTVLNRNFLLLFLTKQRAKLQWKGAKENAAILSPLTPRYRDTTDPRSLSDVSLELNQQHGCFLLTPKRCLTTVKASGADWQEFWLMDYIKVYGRTPAKGRCYRLSSWCHAFTQKNSARGWRPLQSLARNDPAQQDTEAGAIAKAFQDRT